MLVQAARLEGAVALKNLVQRRPVTISAGRTPQHMRPLGEARVVAITFDESWIPAQTAARECDRSTVQAGRSGACAAGRKATGA